MSEFSPAKAVAYAEKYFGLKTAAKPLPGELDDNFILTDPAGRRFVFKHYHLGEERKILEAQNAMLLHLASRMPALELPRVIPNLHHKNITTVTDEAKNERFIRLLTWVDGRVFAKVNPHSPELLRSLGKTIGQLCKGLEGFDHPAAHRYLKWDLAQTAWTGGKIHLIATEEKRRLARQFLYLFENEALAKLKKLRHSVLQNDANDYNVLVGGMSESPQIPSIIDFGDMVHSATVNELAIAIAYAAMDKPDPLTAAAQVVMGCHEIFPLEEKELAILYHLVAARLLISVTASAENLHLHPKNEYLLISEKPAWDLLEKWEGIHPNFAHFTFRRACGLEPCPKWKAFKGLSTSSIFPVDLKDKKIIPLDLSVGSLDLGGHDDFATAEKFDEKIAEMLENWTAIGIGGYGEVRPFYSTDAYRVMGNEGPQWRTVHLGLDVWAPAGTPVLAPFDATVFSAKNNAGERDYGPTVILEHKVDGVKFYTLHGHLSLASLTNLEAGQTVKKGESFAEIGPAPENGNWPPHLHFQVILDMLGNEFDFPGVAFPAQREIWLSVCPDPMTLCPPNLSVEPSPHAKEQNREDLPNELGGHSLFTRREKHLPKNLSLSYRKPLTMLRGAGQYLFDKTGRRYLDTVNNVAHVGHEHPAVVRAAARQNAVLNTNTRYLHPNIIHFAERLIDTLPSPLEVAFFVNSGSEANELALRIARTVTGRHGVLAMEHGYHGNTGACVDVSQYKFDSPGGKGKPDWLDLASPPHQSPIGGETDIQNSLRYTTHHKACFLHETILSCAGQVVLPEGFLQKIYAEMRAAGGLCIADEVQTGVGRMGDFWWAFETQNVVPDIMTIGKPIGNGHPLGAVVTTREIANAFANGMEYFNTFGGNPVSCAVGLEVLRIVEEDGLRQNASEVSAYLMAGLRNLAERHPIIADVRGHGMFLGYELLHPETGRAMAGQTTYLANRLRDLGILASTDGSLHNVIKIKPPMVFSRANTDFLLEMTERVLQEDFMQA